MVANLENDFQNGRQKPFWKKLYCNIFLHQLANFNDQNIQLGVFQVAESNGKGFNMTWSEDPAKFKMAAIFTSANSIFIHIFIYNWHR